MFSSKQHNLNSNTKLPEDLLAQGQTVKGSPCSMLLSLLIPLSPAFTCILALFPFQISSWLHYGLQQHSYLLQDYLFVCFLFLYIIVESLIVSLFVKTSGRKFSITQVADFWTHVSLRYLRGKKASKKLKTTSCG